MNAFNLQKANIGFWIDDIETWDFIEKLCLYQFSDNDQNKSKQFKKKNCHFTHADK